MAKQCLFCPREADSSEDVWSSWILEDLKPTERVPRRIGRHLDTYTVNSAIRVKCVCQGCNNGWMSDLETGNQARMRTMMHGQRTVLNPTEQKLLARWAILKAMVIDAINPRRTSFYLECERTNFKPPLSAFPIGTSVWLARFSSFRGFHAGGTDIWQNVGEVPKAMRGCVTNIVVGHLIIQALTVHVLPMFANRGVIPECNPGAWDVSLLNIWPIFGELVWPPNVAFAVNGPNRLRDIINKWKVGEDIG